MEFHHHFIKFGTYARYFVLYNLGYIENRRAQVILDKLFKAGFCKVNRELGRLLIKLFDIAGA